MSSAAKMRHLATHPRARLEFLRTGRLPQGTHPASPLITLLESISPSDRCRIVGLVVNEALGYTGRRVFANAQQALTWLKPAQEVFAPFPAESFRIKHFQGHLTLDDLAAQCARMPAELLALRATPSSARRPR